MACLVCWDGVSRWCRVVRRRGAWLLVILEGSSAGDRLSGVYRVLCERGNTAIVGRS